MNVVSPEVKVNISTPSIGGDLTTNDKLIMNSPPGEPKSRSRSRSDDEKVNLSKLIGQSKDKSDF